MVVYTVHEPPSPPADRIDRAESLVFVKDGFSWGAALFAPIWLLVKGLWLELLAYLVVVTAFATGLEVLGIAQEWVSLVMTALHIVLGFEASSLVRWKFERKGWRMLGAVAGRVEADCERRFFEIWLHEQPVISFPGTGLSGSAVTSREGGRWRNFFRSGA